MRDGWKDTLLSEVITISRERIDPSCLEPDYELIHWSIPQLDETGGPSNETASEIGSHKFSVLKDSVVYSLLNPRIPRFAKIVGGKRVVCSTEFAVLQPDSSLSLDFLYCFVSSPNFQEQVRSLAKGTTKSRERIDNKEIGKLNFKLPPLSDQKRIVDLISSVDFYIEALQKQLESAKISRNAVLHDLLTAGGDDWVETTLGEVALLNPSEPALSDTAHFAPMDAVHVGKRWLQYTEERRDRNGARARAGDILFARITPCLENGKVAQVQSELERCGGSTEFIVVRGTEKCTSDFLYFWCTLKVNRDKAAELMTGTTGRQRLSWQGLGGLGLWLPSIAEQERIVNNISEFDSLIESTESAITESQNLRSGLLSDLLSGEHEIPASYDKVIGAA
jgi:restriction endonuclease S subunit